MGFSLDRVLVSNHEIIRVLWTLGPYFPLSSADKMDSKSEKELVLRDEQSPG